MEQQSLSIARVLPAVSAANTAAATSAWIATPTMAEGDLAVTLNVGAVTGQIVPTLEDATDDQGAGGAVVAPLDGDWTTVTTSNDPTTQKRCFSIKALRSYYRFVGTVTTGPILIGVTATWHPKDTAATSITHAT